MKRTSIFLAMFALAGLAGSVCAAAELPNSATTAMATQPRRSNWNVPYHPRSRHDFTGLWEQKQGPGWVPGVAVGRAQNPPVTPEYAKIWDGLVAALEAGRAPPANCLPQGMPGVMSMSFPMEIVQNDRQMNLSTEGVEPTRRIYLDGRPFDLSLDRSYTGESIGHWEGDVLAVTSSHFRPETVLEASGLPHSDALIIYERLRLVGDNTLTDEITLVDRKAYARPWTVTKTYERAAPTYRVMPRTCPKAAK